MDRREEIQKLREQGLSKCAIAKKLGVNWHSVHYHLTPRIQHNQRHRRKIYIAQLKQERGGKCEVCGYNRCQASLHFHHKDPKTKSFGICHKSCKGLDKLREEAKKCILVCANCHYEIEWPDSRMEGISLVPAPIAL